MYVPFISIENEECVKYTTTQPKKQKTTKGHRRVTNTARKSHIRSRASADPVTQMCTSSVKYERLTKLRNTQMN